MPAQPEFQQRLKSIERLLGEIEAAADPNLRTTAQELVQLVMDLHGAGLERMLELIRASESAKMSWRSWGATSWSRACSFCTGFIRCDLETRVQQALDKARVRLRPHEGEVELLGFRMAWCGCGSRRTGTAAGRSLKRLRRWSRTRFIRPRRMLLSLLIEDAEGFEPGADAGGCLRRRRRCEQRSFSALRQFVRRPSDGGDVRDVQPGTGCRPSALAGAGASQAALRVRCVRDPLYIKARRSTSAYRGAFAICPISA